MKLGKVACHFSNKPKSTRKLHKLRKSTSRDLRNIYLCHEMTTTSSCLKA